MAIRYEAQFKYTLFDLDWVARRGASLHVQFCSYIFGRSLRTPEFHCLPRPIQIYNIGMNRDNFLRAG